MKTIVALCLALSAGPLAAETCLQSQGVWYCTSGRYDSPPPTWNGGGMNSWMQQSDRMLRNDPGVIQTPTYQIRGNRIYGSDGTSCQVVGGTVLCN